MHQFDIFSCKKKTKNYKLFHPKKKVYRTASFENYIINLLLCVSTSLRVSAALECCAHPKAGQNILPLARVRDQLSAVYQWMKWESTLFKKDKKYFLQWFLPKPPHCFGNFFHWYLCNHRYNMCRVWNMLWKVPRKKRLCLYMCWVHFGRTFLYMKEYQTIDNSNRNPYLALHDQP